MKARWTPAMERKLARLYPTRTAQECADTLGVGLSSVHNRAHLLGLRKSSEWIAERTRQRWAEGRHENSRRAHFRKGEAPANKGVPQAEWMPAVSRRRCARTQFKPGHLGGSAKDNMQPIGALRIADGQLQKKVNNERSFMRRWVAVSRLVWEAAHGPIPDGCIVRFKDGMATTVENEITPDKLECITRAENMRRNSYHTHLPPEVARLVQLRGALNRKINNRTRRHEEQGQ